MNMFKKINIFLFMYCIQMIQSYDMIGETKLNQSVVLNSIRKITFMSKITKSDDVLFITLDI